MKPSQEGQTTSRPESTYLNTVHVEKATWPGSTGVVVAC
jgi:hypothetical protein